MVEIPLDIVKLIKEFIPRDRDMKSRTADLIKEHINECNKAFWFDFDYMNCEEYRLRMFTNVRLVRHLTTNKQQSVSFSDGENAEEDDTESESESIFADDEIVVRLGRRRYYSGNETDDDY